MAYSPVPSNPFTVPGTAAGFLDIRKRGTTGPVVTVAVPAYAGSSATQLATPTGTQATASSQSILRVIASSVANASSYRLYTSATQNGTYAQLGGVLTSPIYDHGGLSAAQTQWYQWQAVGNGTAYSDSARSAPFSGTTKPAPTTPGIDDFTPKQGAAGTALTITGLGFGATQGTGAARIGTVVLTGITWSDTQITGTVANGTLSDAVEVVTNAGVTYQSAIDFQVTAAGPFTVADAPWSKVEELEMVGIVDHDPVYSVSGPATSTTGQVALDEKEVFRQPFTPIGASYGMELSVIKSFGKGRINKVRFFLEKANGDRVGAYWDATTGNFLRFFKIGGAAETPQGNAYGPRPDIAIQANGGGLPALPPFKLAWTTAYNSHCLVMRGAGIYNDDDWHVWDRGLMPFDAVREENLNTTTGFVWAVVTIESEGSENATFDLDGVTAGYLQGVGIANQAPVLWEDGGVVSEGGRFLEGASIPLFAKDVANPFDGVRSSNAVIRDRDLDAKTYRDRAKIWFEQINPVDGIKRHIGHNSVTWIKIGTIWHWFAAKWGTLSDGTEKMGILHGTTPTLPSGPTVLVGTLMNLPDYGGFAEDPGICVKNGVIYFTYSTNVGQAFTAYVGTLDSTLTTFTPLAKTDTTADIREGNKLIDEGAAGISLLVTNAPTTPGVDSKVRVYPFSGIVNGILTTYSTWTNRNLNEAGAPAHPNLVPRRVVEANGDVYTDFYRLAFNGETYDYYFDNGVRKTAPFGWSRKEYILKADKRTAGYAYPLRAIPA